MTLPLEVIDLTIDYLSGGVLYRAVDGATLRVGAGETVGLVGESGSGKSTLALAAGGLLPPNARSEGDVRVNGVSVEGRNVEEVRSIRQKYMGFVFQSAVAALDPTRRVQTILRDAGADLDDARELLKRVALPSSTRILNSFPHELSGGMAQRVAIAVAIARGPSLVIADEPTASLDSSIRNQILTLLFGLRDTIGASILFLSHDVKSVGRFCDRVAVMYAGRIVEDGPAEAVLRHPTHPYTSALLAAVPGTERPAGRLESIPGVPPILKGRSPSCAFEPRCRFAIDICSSKRPEPIGPQAALCFRADELSLTPGVRSA
jgi:oligopeptide/dipeptide ABC transporter ATP-binding protein